MSELTGGAVSAVEEIRAAIEKLTALVYSSSDGPWDAHIEHERAGILAELLDANGDYVIDDGYLADVELVEVLHRTIDAQLAILQNDLKIHADYRIAGRLSEWIEVVERAGALALARAINGNQI